MNSVAFWILSWLPMVPLAIANGVFREKVLSPRLPELRAHQASTLTCALLLGAYMAVLFRWQPLQSPLEAAATGAAWLLLTLAFEFLAGHYLFKNPWRRILRDYNLAAGRMWVLLLAWIALAPTIYSLPFWRR